MNVKIIRIFFLLSVVDCCRGHSSSCETVNTIKEIFSKEEWQHFTNVESVSYRGSKYHQTDIHKLPIDNTTVSSRIRVATLFLDCSYAEKLLILLAVMENFSKYCKNLEEQERMYDCALMVFHVSQFLEYLIKLMKGALDALDEYHLRPWKYNKYCPCIVSSVSISDTAFEYLKDRLLRSRDDATTTMSIVDDLIVFFHQKYFRVTKGVVLGCELNSDDAELLWTKWWEKYCADYKPNPTNTFYNFVVKQVTEEIKSTIKDKYIKLGFQFNKQTQETSVPQISTNMAHYSDCVDNLANEQNFVQNIEQNTEQIVTEFDSYYNETYNTLEPPMDVDKKDLEQENNNGERNDSTPVLIEFIESGKPYYKFI